MLSDSPSSRPGLGAGLGSGLGAGLGASPRLHARGRVLLVLAVPLAHLVVVVIQQVGELGRVEGGGLLALPQLSRGHGVVETGRRSLLPSVRDGEIVIGHRHGNLAIII